MHRRLVLFDWPELMQLIIDYVPEEEVGEWIQRKQSEWHLRLLSWQNIATKETFNYACKIGDIKKLKNTFFPNLNHWIYHCEYVIEWHPQTWQLLTSEFLSVFLDYCHICLDRVQDRDVLERVLPLLHFQKAPFYIQRDIFCAILNTVSCDTFIKLYNECKMSCPDSLLHALIEATIANKRAKPILKWLVQRHSESCNQTILLIINTRFSTTHYYIVKYLIQENRLDSETRKTMFQKHLRDESTCAPYFSKMILLLWQKDFLLGQYIIPHDITIQFSECRKRKSITRESTAQEQYEAWKQLSDPVSFETETKIDTSKAEREQTNLHNAVLYCQTSELACDFMQHIMSIVHNLTPIQFSNAFANTCQGNRFSLACLLWNLAQPLLHQSLAEHLSFAFKSTNINFIRFAWKHAPEIMSRDAAKAAKYALCSENLTTWTFLAEQNLLTDESMFGDSKLWQTLCCINREEFLPVVWKDTSLWESHVADMLDLALEKKTRCVIAFLSQQKIAIDQVWLRRSILTLTVMNVPRMIEKIESPRTLNLKDVQLCYEKMLHGNYSKMILTWWSMFPLTREQLISVPGFDWQQIGRSWLRRLWHDGIANAHDLCVFLNWRCESIDILSAFDLDQETLHILNSFVRTKSQTNI